ncbi:phosphatase PAP2 family protein [Halosimplex salinum]|uniref:phosphatase PAP2 family protein n=1 Tax=Halosimplex salinum TaxID=1710538 RepID=UPI0013DDD94D|nr:phosphatase PAP2 family protein [Halosimplex salinum]
MIRLVEASEVFREVVPAELVPVFWVITALGSAKFLMIGLSLAYWNDHRRRRELLAVISVAFVAVAVTLALKYWFDLPRPPAAVQRYPVEPSPVGFPSGHAIAATTVYGGALIAFDRVRDARAVVGVGALVAAIGLSRVVLGVHYLGDILAGYAVGLVMLGVLAVALERGPAVVFGLAVVLSVPAVLVTTDTGDAALALGGSLGGFAAALWHSSSDRFRSRVERTIVNVAGVAFVGVALIAAEAVETVLLAAAVVNVALAFGIIALPSLVGRVPEFDSVSASD